MTREEVISRLYDRFIKPTEQKKESYIGVEIEMPIVDLRNKAVDFAVVHQLTAAFLQAFDFIPTGFDEEGHVYSAVNSESGDIFSYDCSYNNMEFSFGKEKNLHAIHERFKRYYRFVQDFFKPFHYTLTGMGVNPNRKLNHNIPIENGRYKMLFHHLSSFSKYFYIPMFFHRYPQFGMFSSASQVQLDVDHETLPEIIDTFNKLEPIKALLFSNSVLLGENEDLLCCRDMLWENSTHGVNPHNVGMYDCDIRSVDDIVAFQPQPDDIAYLRTFKFEDLTYRGTIEYRSACCQPISDVMTVAAFHLGLQGKVRELRRLLKNDTTLYHSGYNAVELRRQLVRRELPSTVDPDALYALVQNILDLCREGLSERGQGEEVYLEPLYQRTENRTNPAKEMLRRLQNGESMENVIKSYAEV